MEMRDFQGATSGSLIIAPAAGTSPEGDPICFLFSLSQVEDILGSLEFSRVPFAPSYIHGIANWRGLALPVLSIEVLLGLATERCSYEGTRGLVVKKTGPVDDPEHWKRVLVRIAPGCRMLSSVPKTEPLVAGDYLAADRLSAVKGVYGWEEGLLIVPHLEQILSGELNGVFSDDT
ncbi:chemotaxis protein CheW [Desulfoluna sp.]|uniref:chemotaxis protein CheW n=1 Tax=Desulfoluna sp. TaxID=2045199 RepID=UPI002603EB5A|nr:chemotaxis protein CheW [Desulfoluna sp.]